LYIFTPKTESMRTLLSCLLCFTSTIFPAAGQEALLAEFARKWGNAAEYTLAVAQSMPDSAYGFAPTEEQMTFGEQVLHIVGNISRLSSAYLGAEPLIFDRARQDYAKEDLLYLLQDAFERSSRAVAALQAEDLDQTVEFFAGPLTKRQILLLLSDHLTHHRAQLIVYARMKGVKPPRYVGW
jgi:uncharacterized damage-inducible protein DinB